MGAFREMKREAGVAVAALAAAFLLDGRIVSLASALQHSALTYVMSWFSHLATLVIVLMGMTSLFLVEERKAKWIKPAMLSVAASFVLVTALKLAVDRMRPLPDAVSVWWLAGSFPSMHAALAFAMVPVLDREFPVLKWFWIVFAVMVAVSRVYLGVHYISDVVAGGVIGYAVGKGAVWMQESARRK